MGNPFDNRGIAGRLKKAGLFIASFDIDVINLGGSKEEKTVMKNLKIENE